MEKKMSSDRFEYATAFCRNLGWITPEQQNKLKNSRVAIAGMGGVGGVHLLTLTRLGIGKFNISDFDKFELQNFNRQVGADMHSLGRAKVEVMREKALQINPELEINVFATGVDEKNLDRFLEGVDVYVDGLDVFVLDLREVLFKACAQKGIPVITVAPIGMGAALIQFSPEGMGADEYFGWKGKSYFDKYCRFVVGISSNFLHLKSLVDRSYANAHEKRAPSLPMGCELAAGVMGTEVLKLLLNRGPRLVAPESIHYDAATYRLKKAWIPWGAKNPFFKLKLRVMKILMNRLNKKNKVI